MEDREIAHTKKKKPSARNSKTQTRGEHLTTGMRNKANTRRKQINTKSEFKFVETMQVTCAGIDDENMVVYAQTKDALRQKRNYCPILSVFTANDFREHQQGNNRRKMTLVVDEQGHTFMKTHIAKQK